MDSMVCSRTAGANSHSHTVIQCQPISASFFFSSLSRSLFLRIFVTQKSRLVLGILQHLELSILSSSTKCPCQKQPFTKIHVLYFLSTKSGCPGNRLWFSLYLNPRSHNPRRTITSGFVPTDFTADITLLILCCEDLFIYRTLSPLIKCFLISIKDVSRLFLNSLATMSTQELNKFFLS